MTWRGLAWRVSRRCGFGWFPFMRGEMILPLEAIKLGSRHRQDMGDLSSLAASIRGKGLLHPIVVTMDNVLIAGGRRLAACRQLGWREVPVTVARNVLDAQALLEAERDENTCREDLRPSEKAKLGIALEELERPKAKERKLEGNARGGRAEVGETLPPTSEAGRTRDLVAKAVGMSGTSYTRAKVVAQAAADGSLSEEVQAIAAEALERMDTTGSVVGAYNLLAPHLGKKQSVRATPAQSANGLGEAAAETKKNGARPHRRKKRDPKDAALGAIATAGSVTIVFRELDISAIECTDRERAAWEHELFLVVSAINHFRRQLRGDA